ncbi:glucose dehydrogenase [FAD, quinone] [Arctopsyche grandis]|uniref:glucose dehydrogenase [FAD, quinone] n=1 Tax=Arctopsyche grandis TaxID=121162 RepID=UPI00406D6661
MDNIPKMAAVKVFLLVLIPLVFGQSFVYRSLNDFYRLSGQYPHEGMVKDEKIIQSQYDFIVIGAGSGGSVVTNRLTENPNWDVLLIEAGDDETFLSDIPLLSGLNEITSLNWGYKTDPVPGACLSLTDGVCNWPRGRVLGGTSVINFLIYTRGNKLDYDRWEALGNTGWSYKDVLPYFKKSENVGIPSLKSSPYHGTGGYLNVEHSPYTTEMHKAFRKAAGEMGYKYNDPNGKVNLGFSKAQATMRNGRRCSASRAFLEPIRFRKNFHTSKMSRVTKILIDPQTKRAYGVEFLKNRRKYTVLAKKEVILSAGTIGSAHLLMLSGVGPRDNLEAYNIPVIQDSMVGYNLQDHLCLSGVVFFVNETVTISENKVTTPSAIFDYMVRRRGPYTIPGGAEGIAFVKTKYSKNKSDDYPDIELVMGTGALNGDSSGSVKHLLGISDEFAAKMYSDIQDRESFAINPILLQPRSRGRLSLRSANPFRWPSLQPMYFSDPQDLHVLREGAKMAVEVTKTSGFKRFNATLQRRPFPGCENLKFESDQYWECAIRQVSSTLSHQVGTVKMGPRSDPTAVVDPTLKVIGISGLRVVDASIMPVIPTGHTNAIVFMIGEKASDMIKKDWNYI